MSAIQIIGQLFILRWLAPFQSFQKRLLFAFHSPKIRKNDSNIIGRRLRTRYLSRRHYLDRLGFNDGLSRFLFICFNGDLLSRSLFRSGCWITGFCLLIKKNKTKAVNNVNDPALFNAVDCPIALPTSPSFYTKLWKNCNELELHSMKLFVAIDRIFMKGKRPWYGVKYSRWRQTGKLRHSRATVFTTPENMSGFFSF